MGPKAKSPKPKSPKGKGGKKDDKKGGKKDGKKEAVIIDGVNTTTMSREQLEKFALTVKETLDREREERNYFQLERDKIRSFWEITKQQLEECRAELRIKEREMEQKEDEHQGEAKLFKQKVKHLLYEHQNEVAEVKADAMLSLKTAQEEFDEQHIAVLDDKKSLKEKLQEQQRQHQEEIRGLSMKFSEDLSKARHEFEREAREIEAKYDDKVRTLRNELGLRHQMEITEIDERKNKHINDLMMNHDKAYNEMKNYYNEITLNNMALISSLKEQIEEMKRREDRTEKALKECQRENRNVVEPMRAAAEENKDLKRQLLNYSKDKIALENIKKQLEEIRKDRDDLRWENEVLLVRLEKMENDRNDLRNNFSQAVVDVQEKLGLKTVLIEKKLRAMTELMEQREVLFSEIMTAANIEPKKIADISMKIDKLLIKKNAAIQDLEYELARVCKAHDDLLETYEGKLVQFGIPKDELGFTPLTSGMAVGKGPAGLVTCNR